MKRVTLQESTLAESLTYAKNLLEETMAILLRIRTYYLGSIGSFTALIEVVVQLIIFVVEVAREFGEDYLNQLRGRFALILNLLFPPK